MFLKYNISTEICHDNDDDEYCINNALFIFHNSVDYAIGCQNLRYRMPWKDQYT